MVQSIQIAAHIRTAARIRTARLFPAKIERVSLPFPMATVTFDDFPKNAWTYGGDIVEAAGGHATYYVSGSFLNQNINGIEYFSERDLEEVQQRGHEIGCHTFSHAMLPKLSREEIDRDLNKNLGFIRSATGRNNISSFAYPFGAASIPTKLFLRSRFTACRGIDPGINAGFSDFSQLRAVALEEHILKAHSISNLIEQTRSRNGWLVFLTHDVSDRPSPFGCTPALLTEVVSAIKSAGIELVTIEEALAKIRPRASAVDANTGRPVLKHA